MKDSLKLLLTQYVKPYKTIKNVTVASLFKHLIRFPNVKVCMMIEEISIHVHVVFKRENKIVIPGVPENEKSTF